MPRRPSTSLAQLRYENEALRLIVTELQWMARRYATGRRTYAPSSYNAAIRRAVSLGMTFREDTTEHPPTIWATDGDDAA
jgi:epoxyqueuosine reductase QueG